MSYDDDDTIRAQFFHQRRATPNYARPVVLALPMPDELQALASQAALRLGARILAAGRDDLMEPLAYPIVAIVCAHGDEHQLPSTGLPVLPLGGSNIATRHIELLLRMVLAESRGDVRSSYAKEPLP